MTGSPTRPFCTRAFLRSRAGDRNGLADRVVLGAGRAAELVLAGPGQDVDFALHVGRERVERLLRASEPGVAFDDAELELRGGLDDVLDAGRIVDAGKLDDDAVAALAER